MSYVNSDLYSYHNASMQTKITTALVAIKWHFADFFTRLIPRLSTDLGRQRINKYSVGVIYRIKQ